MISRANGTIIEKASLKLDEWEIEMPQIKTVKNKPVPSVTHKEKVGAEILSEYHNSPQFTQHMCDAFKKAAQQAQNENEPLESQ